MNKGQLDEIKARVAKMSTKVAEIDKLEHIAFQDVPALIAEVERLNRIEKIALHFMERETKLQNAITQVLEIASDAEGELIERVEQVLLDVLEGDDACL